MLTLVEIQDFKSFVGNHTIPVNSFTCIIGPNGSGKSNLLDAILFAMNRPMTNIVSYGKNRASVSITVDDVKYTRIFEGNNVYLIDDEVVESYNVDVIFNLQNELDINVDLNYVEQITGSNQFKGEYDRLKVKLNKIQNKFNSVSKHKNQLQNQVKIIKRQQKDAQRLQSLGNKRRDLKIQQALLQLQEIDTKTIPKTVVEVEDFTNDLKANQQKQASIKKKLIKNDAKINLIQKEEMDNEQKFYEIKEKRNYVNSRLINLKELITKEGEEIKDKRSKLQGLVESEKMVLDSVEPKYSVQSVQEYQRIMECKKQTRIARKKIQAEKELNQIQSMIEQVSHDLLQKKQKKRDLEIKLEKEELEKHRSIQRKKRNKQLLIENEEKLELIIQQIMETEISSKEQQQVVQQQQTLQKLKRIEGVYDSMRNIIKPTQQKYQKAIEVAMGASMNHIVVSTREVAIQCVEFIKLNRLGVYTFIPMQDISPKYIQGSITEKMQYSVAYEAAVKYCVGDVVYCDDTAQGGVIAKGRVKVVCLDGTIWHKNGLISGGGSSELKQHDLAELLVKKESLEKEINKLQTESVEVPDTNTAADLVLVTEVVAGLQARLDGLMDELETLKSPVEELTMELLTVEEENKNARAVAIQEFMEKYSIKDIDDFILETTPEKMQLSSTKHRLRNLIVFDEQRLEQLQSRQEEHMKLSKKYELQLQELDAEASKNSEHVSSISAERQDLANESKKLKVELEQMKSEYELLASKQAVVSQKLQALKEEQLANDALRDELQASRTEIVRYCIMEELQLPTTVEWDSIDFENDAGKLELDYSSISKKNLKGVQQELAEVEAELQTVQPLTKAVINSSSEKELKAKIEEFNNLKADVKATKKQFEDVKKKRLSKFLDGYKFLEQNIDPIYKALTKTESFPMGGTAYLSLDNPNDPFAGGIKYHAMPPLKRFQEMHLLSGGEKTMVALALLFAVQKYNGKPLLMDEIDAALDNGNVQQILKYISETERLGQVIVISLKSMFYQRAAQLIGVYRRESSKVLTLDLQQYA